MDLEQELGHQCDQLETLTEEKLRLMRELAQLRATVRQQEEASGAGGRGYYYTSSPQTTSATAKPLSPVTSTTANANLVPKVSNNSAITSVGALRLYEFFLGIFFIAAMMNWILV